MVIVLSCLHLLPRFSFWPVSKFSSNTSQYTTSLMFLPMKYNVSVPFSQSQLHILILPPLYFSVSSVVGIKMNYNHIGLFLFLPTRIYFSKRVQICLNVFRYASLSFHGVLAKCSSLLGVLCMSFYSVTFRVILQLCSFFTFPMIAICSVKSF